MAGSWLGATGPGYVVQDGEIICPAEGGGNLFTEKEYSNFAFRFEFKLTPGANNGIGIRAPYEGDAAYKGMEIQILDDSDPKYKGVIKPEQYHGSVYQVIPARTGFRKPVGEWNEEEIMADGRRIRVTLNNVITWTRTSTSFANARFWTSIRDWRAHRDTLASWDTART